MESTNKDKQKHEEWVWEGTGWSDNEGDGKKLEIINDKNAQIIEKVSKGLSSAKVVSGRGSQK